MNLALRSVEELLKLEPYAKQVNAELEVQDRYREAAMVLWKQPREAEQRYLTSADRCCWPHYVRDWHAYGYERARMPRIPAQPRQVDRMEQLLEWHCWLATQNELEAKCVWDKFALHHRNRVIGIRYGMNRNYVGRTVKSGIQRIVDQFILTAWRA